MADLEKELQALSQRIENVKPHKTQNLESQILKKWKEKMERHISKIEKTAFPQKSGKSKFKKTTASPIAEKKKRQVQRNAGGGKTEEWRKNTSEQNINERWNEREKTQRKNTHVKKNK